MKIDILSKGKKKGFVEGLRPLGIEKIPQMLVRSGKERIRAFSGDLTREQIMDIWHLLPIEGIGLYVGKDMVNRNGVHEVRLSLDGMHVWKNQLEKSSGRIVQLSEEQEREWFLGRDVELSSEQIEVLELSEGNRFVCVKSFDGLDFIGVGKLGSREQGVEGRWVLFGFLPKERRRKERGSC